MVVWGENQKPCVSKSCAAFGWQICKSNGFHLNSLDIAVGWLS
jgi:hypothetical protein